MQIYMLKKILKIAYIPRFLFCLNQDNSGVLPATFIKKSLKIKTLSIY